MRAVEDAVGVQIPENARIIRNLLHGVQFQHDHIVHFYGLSALDWVDVVSALKADPKKAAKSAQSISDWPANGVSRFKATQERLKKLGREKEVEPLEVKMEEVMNI